MMTERVKMRYVSCPSCGKQLFKVAGNCSVEITCVRCKKEIVGVVDEIYMKIFENCRGIRKKPADTLQIWKHYDSGKEQCSNNIQKRYRI